MRILERDLLPGLKDHLREREFSIITGARQTGKTTLLNQLELYLKQQNEAVFFLTLEDPAILSRLDQHPENLFDFAIGSPDKRLFVLIDEIQYLKDPSNFLKLLYDKHSPRLKLIVTGSSAFYIDSKFRDSLAGRKRLFEIFSLGFAEFLRFRTGENELAAELARVRSNPGFLSPRRNELDSYFNEYLTYGGYPAVVLTDGPERKIEKLKELTGSFLKRDILESNIQDQEKFYHLLLLLANQTGALVNTNELSRTLRLSVTAVENYLMVLRKCFHVQLLRPFYSNIRKELIKMPKVYFNDLGFRNVLQNQFGPWVQRPDAGAMLENYAFIRLREIYGSDNLRFWRTADGQEVDFVIPGQNNLPRAIEIKFDETGFIPGKYAKFLHGYPGAELQCRAFKTTDNRNSILAL